MPAAKKKYTLVVTEVTRYPMDGQMAAAYLIRDFIDDTGKTAPSGGSWSTYDLPDAQSTVTAEVEES